MIRTVEIENFRSIEKARLELGSVSVFYGETASGKSSVFYALCALRNFLYNPNQPPDGLFNLGFQDLGGFDQCVFDHKQNRHVRVSAAAPVDNGDDANYEVSISKTTSTLRSRACGRGFDAEVPLPYPVNQTFAFEISNQGRDYTANWNGITFTTVSPKEPSTEGGVVARQLATELNYPTEAIKHLEIAPQRRGFFKPFYTPSPVSPTPWTEDEVASIMISDINLASRISSYTSEITNRDFRAITEPGTSIVRFQSTEFSARTPVLLVNEGYGVNQLIYLLAKILKEGAETIMIEEPEVHLHNAVTRDFARACSSFVHEEGRQLMFTTHSGGFITALLACVAEGRFSKDELRFFEVTKEMRRSNFIPRAVTEDGQIEGGLSSLAAPMAEDVKSLVSRV